MRHPDVRDPHDVTQIKRHAGSASLASNSGLDSDDGVKQSDTAAPTVYDNTRVRE